MIRRSLALTVVSIVLLTAGGAKLTLADEPAAAIPADVATPAAAPTVAAPSSVAPSCTPVYAPVYIEDWGRLAALTQSDPLVFSKAEFWAKRREQANWVLGTGLILGGGAAALGTLDRLTTDAWSNTSKWSIAGGVGAALVSFLAYLAYSPDGDDLLTVINQWNLRHPDRLLAP
jgi:hypothetical protein